ncbi:hypothetical protein CNX65_15890 [Actinosynnema pretiosum]|uniref:Nitroreductase domain-containing protein n=1 Tax=Actinosynnema pretiosum TaxID=42197 RepID=A0A290Z6G6_9PSEU|nr:hypothetical protein CNX65_15890 [Actinosynnema pretiosum]
MRTAAGGPPAVDGSWLWDRLALSARGRPGTTPGAIPAELAPVLRLFDAATAGSLTGGPSVPSAGALYPYEHLAVVTDPDGVPSVYAVDPARRRCRLAARGRQVRAALVDGGLADPAQALVLVVLRPWLSMRKYGDRGYVYAQLDAAHVATHLLCLAQELGERAELRSRACGAPLGALLDLERGCRAVHSALVVTGCAADPVPGWTVVDGRGDPVWTETPSWLEVECWRSLEAYRAAPPPAAPGALPRLPLLAGDRAEHGFPSGQAATALAARRRSSKDFAAVPLPLADLERALAALGTPLALDAPHDARVRATLVARRVTGVAPGSYPLPDGLPGTRLVAGAPGDEELVSTCMGQEHLRNSAALVLLHTDRESLLRDGAASIEAALLRAGALAHLLYLGAAGAGVAVTAIGGFDGCRWRALAGLPGTTEVLYAVLLGGAEGAAPTKLDRLQPAYAHNAR